MVSLEKWMILTTLQKLLKNGEDWGKLIVAKGFKKLPKVQNIAQSGHTGPSQHTVFWPEEEVTWPKEGLNLHCPSSLSLMGEHSGANKTST